MASLWKRANSQYWVACFTDRMGKQRKRSTGTSDRKEATKIAQEFEAAAQKRRTAQQVRKVIADLHRELADEEVAVVSTRTYFASWLDRKKPENSVASFASYSRTVSKFLEHIGALADAGIEEITRTHITQYRNTLAKTLSSVSVNHEVKILKMAFRAARQDGLLIENPGEFVETVRKTAGVEKRRPFTIPELQAVLAIADSEWRSLVLCGLYTGQRLADLASLTWENVDLEREEIRLATRKTGRRMILPMAPPLLAHLEELPMGDRLDSPLHPRAFAVVQRERRTGSLSNQFGDLLAQAGLRQKKSHQRSVDGKGRSGPRGSNALSFHSLRRTATTLLHEAGIPPAVAQELIGHDSEEVHRLYVNVGNEALRKAAAALPEILSSRKYNSGHQ